ncbi:hypothetical protein [Streptomyces sp. NBC_01353]|uniref:hypothetical protein n=1 Tax=Streptomyces sp. NBC_01353 TaxID=2903835 RepID=UPI002E30E898|nr:hypothetical protein [Streptomyces sp. NBC_01353]
MSPAWVVVGLALLAGVVTALRTRRAEAVSAAAWRRTRTVEQVMADRDRWRADRRMREAREDTAICEAIYALPVHIPQQRKEQP